MVIRNADIGQKEGDYYPVAIETDSGLVACHYYEALPENSVVVWVGGIGGGWDTPARGLYPRLCSELTAQSISSLRVRFRNPVGLADCVSDVRTALDFLSHRRFRTIGLVGHSLGGAVVITAAAGSRLVRTVVALSTQSYGTSAAADLAPCSILLIHGKDDTVLPPASSEYVYRIASQPKKLVLLPGTGHVLDEAAEEVYKLVREWLIEKLTQAQL